MAELIRSLSQQEQLNFLLTNRIPRRLATRLMGWYSGIESRWLTRLSVSVWQLFADDLRLDEARKRDFTSLRDCFTRELVDGARPIDPRKNIVVSPCDAIIGACGKMAGTTLFQAKGFPYELADLIPDAALQHKYRDGIFVTLRLKSSMYHRFHAPIDCDVRQVTYISGDTWNVNPIALRRIEKLYCKNERAVMDLHTESADSGICLVAVAAILVASIRLHCLAGDLDMNYQGPERLGCSARYARGDELGYFQHGSTIILFATPDHAFCDGIETGKRIFMGEALLRKCTP
ncbi:MAG: archaetidylserine decarboxylase [Halieaceae bacterium]|jgi:phosphatidylserine decarboxylase|nr:archaetidylserine decarboxylase [Halieaceae bacterium]